MFQDWALLGAPRSYGKHEGLDFDLDTGDPVLACKRGVVVWASDQRRTGGDSLYGKHIIIKHGDGIITWYAHLSHMLVSVDDIVQLGQQIGMGGSTGNSTGPHLHLTVQHIGHGLSGYVVPDVVDPLDYLDRGDV